MRMPRLQSIAIAYATQSPTKESNRIVVPRSYRSQNLLHTFFLTEGTAKKKMHDRDSRLYFCCFDSITGYAVIEVCLLDDVFSMQNNASDSFVRAVTRINDTSAAGSSNPVTSSRCKIVRCTDSQLHANLGEPCVLS